MGPLIEVAIAIASVVVIGVLYRLLLREIDERTALQLRIIELEAERTKLYDVIGNQQALLQGWATAAHAWRGTAVHLLGVVDPEAADTAKRAIAKSDTKSLLQRASVAGVAGSTAQ